MTEILTVNLITKDNKVYANSLDIANKLGKNHRDVLSKIREVLTEREFSLSSYKDKSGKENPLYYLDKDAFILLICNYTGYNDFKRAYIKRFNEMEKLLSKSSW